ncbi:protein draper-like, partial [Ylistrum balloti]|uniref:protein draper-like n=1 Tax=Ylistrum balloti TaxID=509963 RepID=UPI002905869E
MATREVINRGVYLVLFLMFNTCRPEGNIAALKSAQQSSNQHTGKWLAEAAVDTCTNTDIASDCCTHTSVAGNPKTVWWRVDLGQRSTIDTIQIIYRAGFGERLGGYHLYISNNTDSPTNGVRCYEDTSTTEATVQLNIIHQCPYVGRYVTVYNYRNVPPRYTWYDARAVLELCEVIVLGCAAGHYGDGNCEKDCPETCYGGNCNPKSGSCFYCFPRKYGSACDMDCSTNCKGSLCNKDSGHCLECVTGKYGNICDQDCSANCKNSLCEKANGNCYGCVRGKYGDLCDQDCSDNCNDSLCERANGNCFGCVRGKYGDLCDQHCSVYCNDSLCEKANGNCFECVPGKYGDTCDQDCSAHCNNNLCMKSNGYCIECIPGKYGDTCDQDCSADCNNNLCMKSNGYCIGCVDGLYGTNCSMPCNSNCSECYQQNGECTKCKPGLYGMSCNTSCGHCSSCKKDTGLCVDECDPGYQGPYCETRQDQRSDTPGAVDTGSIVGALVGVVVVLVIAAVIVVIIRRRRLSASKQDSFDDIGHHKDYDGNVYDQPLERVDSHADSGIAERNVYSNALVPDEKPDELPNDSANVYVNAENVSRKSDIGDNVYYNSGPVGFPVSDLKSLVIAKMKNKSKAFEIEYKSIPYGALHEHKIGMLQQNKAKNRFKTTFPYDHSRVILGTVGNDPHSDYINANYIDSATKTAEYVATQGPRPGTVNDFWRMIWQLRTGKIVMLTNLVEGAKPKCDKYWPDEGEPMSTTHFNIILDRERSYAFYVIRDLTVTEKKTKTVRQVHQFHYTTWPDHGTPDPNELVVFHRRVKNYQNALTGKMVVHC